MIRHALLSISCFASLAAGCAVEPAESPAFRTITHADTAALDADHRLALDLRTTGYTIDGADGPVDLRYVDVVTPAGRTQPIEELVTGVVETGVVPADALSRGFSVWALGDEVQISGASDQDLWLPPGCWYCTVYSDGGMVCIRDWGCDGNLNN